MISFTIRCADGHRFEGWFRDNAAYDDQVAAGALACPICGTVDVQKAPMAPAIAKHRGRGDRQAAMPDPSTRDPSTPDAPAAGGAPAGEKSVQMGGEQAPQIPPAAQERLVELMTAWRKEMKRIRSHVEANAEHVGDRFADEALAIHYGEAEKRDIYGEATQDETERLTEEGVTFARIPWLPDEN